MKKLLFTVAAFAVATVTTPQAFSADGGFYIEPGITYEKGDNTANWGILGDSTGTTSGLGVNVKLGMHINDIFFAGLDGGYSMVKFDNSAGYDADATSITYGAIIGAQMPIVGLRVWGGYILGGDLDPKEDGLVDVKLSGAKGPKVGVGFKVMMVSLNLEYMDLEYGSVSTQGGLELTNNLKNKVGLVSVSFPLTL